MSYQRSSITAACLATILAMQSFLLAEEKQQLDVPKNGTDLGNYVPTTTTWVVLSPTLAKFNGNNTCLAGIYRKEKAISIYAQTEDQNVWNLLQAVDRALLDHPELKAYIVINKPRTGVAIGGVNRSSARFTETLTLAQRNKFKRVDVSLCRSPSKYLFDKQTPLKFVYSEKRIVKLSKKFSKTDQAIKEVPALIAEVIKLSAAQ